MVMLEQGAEGIEVNDPALIRQHLEAGDWDASVFDGQDIVTGQVTLRTLFADPAQAENCRAALQRLLERENLPLLLESTVIPYTDWQEKWKESFPPLPIGKRLWIKPYWLTEETPDGRIPVVIDPGMAFGTGDHATTAMALALMEEYLVPGHVVMDLGCGTGILSIAGLKLGAKKAVAVDIDDVCAPVVQEHFQLNQIRPEQYDYSTGDILTDEKLQWKCRRNKAQILVANITADVIFHLAGIAGRFLAPDGYFICSGILEEYSGKIAQQLVNSGFIIVTTRKKDGWVAFACAMVQE